jgi:hypothetical protein
LVDEREVVRSMPGGGSGDRAGGSRGGPGAARGPLIHVNTRCESLEEFVEKFAGLASEGALVLPASGELPIGTEGRFAIRLKDQSVAMRGRCRVTGARPAPSAPAGGGPRPTLLRVLLLDMEEGSASVHRRLLARRRVPVPVAIPPAVSEPTIVSPPRPEVTAPPPLRVTRPPPVSGRAATMIGMSPLGRAGASPAMETRAGPPAETRTPGASFTLPANPLSELDATDLASFIDSTLLESDDEDQTLERVADGPARDDGETLERLAPARPAHVPVEATAPTMIDSSPVRTPSRDAGHKPPATQGSSVRAWAIVARAAPYLLCAIAGIGIGRLLGHPAPKTAAPTAQLAPAPPKTVAPPVSAMPAAEVAPIAEERPPPDPPPRVPTEAPRRAATAAKASVAAGSDGCSARVITEPSDAKVSWRGQTLGRSPIGDAKIPCGAGTLTIAHERYQTITREVTAAAETPVDLTERLHRPPATLIVGSSPPGAAISVNGQALGAAPRRLPTARYEQVSIRATLAGYPPWTKKVYLSEATTKVTAQLGSGGRGR